MSKRAAEAFEPLFQPSTFGLHFGTRAADDANLARAARLEAERFRTIFESSPECIKVVARDGALLEMNPAGLKFLEAESIAQVRAHGLANFVLPAFRPAFLELFTRTMAGASGVLEFEVCGLRGARRWLETHATPLIDGHGEVSMMLGITRDITAFKQAAERLRRSEENLALTLQSIGDAVIATDRFGHVTRMNGTAERLIGQSASAAIGRPLVDILFVVNTATREPLANPAARVLATGHEFATGADTSLISRDGREHRISVTAAPIRDGGDAIVGVVLVFREVTDAVRLQQSLASVAEMLMRAGQMAKIGGWMLDLQTQKLTWSPETFRIHDLPPPVPPSVQEAFDFYPQPGREQLRTAYRAAIDRGTSWDLELPMTSAAGRALWVRVQGSVLSEESSGPVKLVGAIQDITQRHTAEVALRVSDVALKSISQGVIIAAADQRILSVNAAFTEITGYRESEVLGRSCRFLQGAHTDPATVERIRECLHRHAEFSGEILNYRKDGLSFWNELTISPVFESDGRTSHFIGITRDVSARKQADQSLRETEALARLRLHRILDEVAAYSITFDAQQRILHVSAGLIARAGYPPDALLGQPLSLLLGDTQALRAWPQLRADDDIGDRAVHQLRARDGSWWPVYMVATLPSSGADSNYLLVGRDREAEVAAEIRLEWLRQMIRKSQEQLNSETAQRQQLELAFLGISEREQARIGQDLHDDVGQQLAGIAFLGRALQKRLANAGREEAQDAEWIAQLLAQTLDSLRAISRDLSPGGLETGNLEKSLRSLCARSERLHGVNCQVNVYASEAAIAALTPVLSLNLFRIAQEALNNGLRHGSAEWIVITLRLRDTSGTLAVRDNGIGFDVARSFEGIGLRNIRIRVRGLFGRLRICSGPSGTLIAARFPMSTSPATEPVPSPA